MISALTIASTFDLLPSITIFSIVSVSFVLLLRIIELV